MSATAIVRPVYRKFTSRQVTRAAAHVRKGGHAVVESEDGVLDLLLTVDATGGITELGFWSLLSIEQRRWRRVKHGPAKGLATARVGAKYEWSVLDWCRRDSTHAGPTRRIRLDCLACGACCYESNVVVDLADLGRWLAAGRDDLLDRERLKRKDGRITLRFASSGRCQNLCRDNRCAIYPIRPGNCAAFAVGSEACLAARHGTLGIRDGLDPED